MWNSATDLLCESKAAPVLASAALRSWGLKNSQQRACHHALLLGRRQDSIHSSRPRRWKPLEQLRIIREGCVSNQSALHGQEELRDPGLRYKLRHPEAGHACPICLSCVNVSSNCPNQPMRASSSFFELKNLKNGNHTSKSIQIHPNPIFLLVVSCVFHVVTVVTGLGVAAFSDSGADAPRFWDLAKARAAWRFRTSHGWWESHIYHIWYSIIQCNVMSCHVMWCDVMYVCIYIYIESYNPIWLYNHQPTGGDKWWLIINLHKAAST